MSATTKFRFFHYELRPATPEDIALAHEWTRADKHHDGVIAPEFWLEQDKGVDCYVLTDRTGPVLFLRMEKVVRFLIQFSPAPDRIDRERLREAMRAGLGYLEMSLGAVGVGEIVFDSVSPTLRTFVGKALGFAERSTTLSRTVRRFNYKPKAATESVKGTDGATAMDESTVDAIPATLQGGR